MIRPARKRNSAHVRTLTPVVDSLEARSLLSTGAPSVVPIASSAQPLFEVAPFASGATPPASAYTPAQVRTAYGFNAINFGSAAANGAGETIAIVDAQDDPNIQADLNTFDAQFGLPAATVTRVNQTGGTTLPATDSTGGWETEEALDVEWAHAMAPGAKLLLVEANSSNFNDLIAAADYAAAHANVVSMSWGGSEFSGENAASVEAHFNHPGVAFVAASGDSGAPASWPAISPNVLSVGGTALQLGSGGAYSSESAWSGSGGGPSTYEAQPAYQAGVVTQTALRGNPDVAYDASPSTGFAAYDSFPENGSVPGWMQVGGTSAGAPQWAALLAIADQGRALSGLPALDSSNPQQVQNILYQNAGTAAFHDVISGNSAGSPYYSAARGYDFATGIGSPVANLVVQALDGGATTAAAPDHLVLTAPTAVTAGTPFNLTVTVATPAGATDTGYTGTVYFTTADGLASLPANYTFTAADAGSHTFTVTLSSPGSQSVTATDTANGAVTGTLSPISVSPAAPLNLTAQTASTSQINLSWTAATGATGYTVERSANGGTSWTQVATTGAGVTSYDDTGLAGGTTYSYRVRATGGGLASAYSNTASATTASASTGTGTTTTDTLWGNSYVPSEDEYAYGSYEVGMKFTSDVSGTVTGVRFYKQTWMGGAVHVGHLWSANGTLLATATFTNETAYGWQQVNFSNSVTIAPNTVYIVSFSTGGGYFGITSNGLAAGVNNGPLHALGNGAYGGDGVYGYGTGAFPNVSGGGMNFWADVAFTPSSATPSVSTTTVRNLAKAAAVPSATETTVADKSTAHAVAASPAAVVSVSWPYRRTVAQALALSVGGRKGWWG